MNTTIEDNAKGFSFREPAVYQIKVQGELDQYWSLRLGGMQINVIKKQGTKAISVLVGRVIDQAAFSGILKSLYDLQLTVLSVKVLEEIDDNK